MSANSSILPGALWATREDDTTRPTSWARSVFGGLLIEAGLIGVLGAIVVAQQTPIQPEVIMQVEMVKPEAPKPPPPPPVEEIVKQKPVVQKTVPRKIVMAPLPKPASPQPVVEPTPPTPAPVIAAAEQPAPEAPAVATPAPAAAPAKASAPVAMTLACPVQEAPEMPAKALAAGVEGRVVARAKIKAGKVISVEIVKADPPGMFDAAVRSAMMRYRCEDNANEIVVADQTFNFRIN